jgi:membrane protein DedA with SNARE-associated domain
MDTKIIAFLSTWGLVGTFLILYLSGLGLPIPEEVTLLASGYVASTGAFSPWTASAVAVAGILLGDSTIYYIGRRWGRHALDGPLRRMLTPERVARAEDAFHRRKDWFLFGARFVAGVRVVAYFTAGMLRVSYWRFLFLDTLGALISGPTSVFAAWYLGTYLELEDIERLFRHYRNWVFVGLLLLVLLALVARILYRDFKASMLPQQPAPASQPAPLDEPSRGLVPRSPAWSPAERSSSSSSSPPPH